VKRFIVAMIFEESAIISFSGAFVGIVVREIARRIITERFQTAPVAIRCDDLIKCLFLGLIAGTMGSSYPACKAKRINPVRAF
jgi:ABC-type antimicrobial peptide transport system permease subunit